MKNFLIALFVVLFWLPKSAYAETIEHNDIVVLFDNDVHGYMTGYPKIAALRKDMLRITPNVAVVSLGDFAQGGPLCSVSHGQYAVDVMNRVGYDYITLGNHEFDYGLDQLNQLTKSLQAKTLLANFTDLKANKLVYPPYAIRQFGEHKVAFIGVVTPVTKTSDSPHSFVDENGKDIYSFGHENFYEIVQKNVDEVRMLGADIVILMAHLGDIDASMETSEETIRRTTGIDAVLDGHAHNVISMRKVCNLKGDSIPLASTGAHFKNIGRLIIKHNGKCKTELIAVEDYKKEEIEINQLLASFQAAFDQLPTIAVTPYDLAGFDPQHGTYDRNCQTNLGTLCADAFRVMSHADIGWINAGGIRNSINTGKITFKELLSAFPFENHICVAEFTGQQIIDALEFGVSRFPEDNGSFPQVSGLLYEMNAKVSSNIQMNSSKVFTGVGEGPRRVFNVRILNRDTNTYESIDPKKTYSIASIDFILKNRGCNGILDNGNIIADDRMIDIQLMEDFLNMHLHGIVDDEYKDIKRF